MNYKDFHIFEKLNEKIIFFPESLSCYKLDENSYNILKNYKKRNIDLPTELKEFIENNRIKNSESINKEKIFYDNINFNTLVLNVVQECNMKCIYCFADNGTYGNTSIMKFETVKLALEKLYNNKFDQLSISFFGGEPLLNFKLIKEVVEYIEKNFDQKPSYNITTNGTLLNEETAKFLKKYNFKVMISIDGNEEENNLLRPLKNNENSFRKIVNGIKLLEKFEIDYYTRITVTKFNQEFDDFWKVYKFKNVVRAFVAPEDYTLLPDLKKYNKKIESYVSGKDNTISEIILSSIIVRKNRIKNKNQLKINCLGGVREISLSADGNLYMCHRATGIEKYYIGNIFKNTHDEIIKSAYNLFNKIMIGIENERCKKCWAKNLCGGGCHLKNDLQKGYPKEIKNYFCELIKLEYEWAMVLLSKEIANKETSNKVII
ncbi:radical SAM/SPASM domain-containing protein [Marinitoga aeolica]|uniref:Radical SAM protein n=1 Tax=Marinitoga aeolica TaxID=2809031 RepID=A0ABY8PN87_9BACT|nr:radical SAM protein [Marinitoga aeolica]WGS64112.1 radical SAM protein [Marinitoga aeolica]